MAYQRIRPPSEISWENPVADADWFPALGDIAFPADARSQQYKEALRLLSLFYCGKRKGGEKDVRELKHYLRDPMARFLVVWGDVGAGKSSFLRYHLAGLDRRGTPGANAVGGVIDMLRGAPGSAREGTAVSVYRQLCPILEGYFSDHLGSTYDAVLESKLDLARERLGETADAIDVEALAQQMTAEVVSQPSGERYALELMDTVEGCSGPPLFVAVDNIDRTDDAQQEVLLRLSTTLLRNAKLRLIIPLRKSSSVLGNHFKGLQEFRWEQMELSALDLEDMLAPRFEYDQKGDSIASASLTDRGKRYTYGHLFRLLFPSPAKEGTGQLLVRLAGRNARVFLSMVAHALRSEQLDGLHNLQEHEHVVAALMLSEDSAADPFDTYVLNLFENHEPGIHGNNLIRFRVLEFLSTERTATPRDARFSRHFTHLGYSDEQVLQVLALLVSRGLLASSEGIEPDEIRKARPESIGPLSITASGSLYFEDLLKSMWYFVAAKRSIFLPDSFRSRDAEEGHEYVTHSALVEFLAEEEEREREVLRKKEREIGPTTYKFLLPSELARQALRQPSQRSRPTPRSRKARDARQGLG